MKPTQSSAVHASTPPAATAYELAPSLPDHLSAQQGAYLESACRIGWQLCRDALWHENRCNWLGWMMQPLNQSWQAGYCAMGSDLYSGTAGIALFLAELWRRTGDSEVRLHAEGAINQALRGIDLLDAETRLGFYTGPPGVSWSFMRVAHLFEHEELLQRGLLGIERAAQHEPCTRALDVIGGSAGLIPLLIDTAHQYQRPHLLDRALVHAHHLADLAITSDAGCYWPSQPASTVEQEHTGLTGHSHGVAGMVTALLEAYAVSGDQKLLEVARQGLRYERSQFRVELDNWPDFRMIPPGQVAPCTLAWCHGAPGIGLSRLRTRALLNDDPEVEREIEAALSSTSMALQTPFNPQLDNYSLCHGRFGNADFLLEAATRLDRPALSQLAAATATEALVTLGQAELPWPCGVNNVGETPGLLLGLAGIGYFLLRLIAPAEVPSVLLLEPANSASSQPPNPLIH